MRRRGEEIAGGESIRIEVNRGGGLPRYQRCRGKGEVVVVAFFKPHESFQASEVDEGCLATITALPGLTARDSHAVFAVDLDDCKIYSAEIILSS